METTAKYGLKDLFIDSLIAEWRIFQFLGKAVAGTAVFVVVQAMNIVRDTAALVIDGLRLGLGLEVRAVVHVRGTDNS